MPWFVIVIIVLVAAGVGALVGAGWLLWQFTKGFHW